MDGRWRMRVAVNIVGRASVAETEEGETREQVAALAVSSSYCVHAIVNCASNFDMSARRGCIATQGRCIASLMTQLLLLLY